MFNIYRHWRKASSVKKILTIALISVIIFSICFSAFAHSGRTDSNGGHYNRSTGEYHYHHGYSAHQHTNGDCPYESSGFSLSLSKILIFIVGLLAFPLYVNIILGGFISIFLDFISSKYKKTEPTPEEQLLIDEKHDKIYGVISIVLFIIEIIVWAIIVF